MKEPKFRKYLFSYYHEGSWWSFTIAAPSEADAQARLKILHRARYDGILYAEIPNFPGAGLVTRLLAWWKGMASKRSNSQ